jgi:hypothetical protein
VEVSEPGILVLNNERPEAMFKTADEAVNQFPPTLVIGGKTFYRRSLGK